MDLPELEAQPRERQAEPCQPTEPLRAEPAEPLARAAWPAQEDRRLRRRCLQALALRPVPRPAVQPEQRRDSAQRREPPAPAAQPVRPRREASPCPRTAPPEPGK